MKHLLMALMAVALFSCGNAEAEEAKKKAEASAEAAAVKVEQQLQDIEKENKAILEETENIEAELDKLMDEL